MLRQATCSTTLLGVNITVSVVKPCYLLSATLLANALKFAIDRRVFCRELSQEDVTPFVQSHLSAQVRLLIAPKALT